MEREVEDLKRRQTAVERMMASHDHLTYHSLVDLVREAWHEEGFTDETIDEYKLGFCDRCPTDLLERASYTIPIFDSSWTQLLNIRHRLIGAEGGDKYRPHMSGLGRFMFNSRWTRETREILMVEGEKKSIFLSQEVMPTIGILGAHGFNMKWLERMTAVRRLYVGLDPDVYKTAFALARQIKQAAPRLDVRLVRFIDKPDDMLREGFVNRSTFLRYLDWARRIA